MAIADKLRGAMNADDFRDYMLSFSFCATCPIIMKRTVKKELGSELSEK